MNLACFCMFRNEAAILGPFLDQLTSFFDNIILLDHGSTDAGPAMIAARNDPRIELLTLKAAGYPQQQLATGFAEMLLSRYSPDFVFFLDCDEFLPFADRASLEAFLRPHRQAEAVTLQWTNICPASLDGGDIFRGNFLHRGAPSEFTKVILTGEMAKRRGWVVSQGYHSVAPAAGETLNIVADSTSRIYHIPVQSRMQFRFKIAHGARMLRRNASLLNSQLGWHWVRFDEKAGAQLLDEATLRGIALNYGDQEPQASTEAEATLDFHFPYITSAFREDAETLSAQLEGLLQHYDRPPAPGDSASFVVTDKTGQVVLSSGPVSAPQGGPERRPPVLPPALFAGSLGEQYAALIEPLFNMPTKLPVTAWAGHIPFLFALFRALQPSRYVELGVHNGASLIAAATAAATYRLPTLLTGVDTWEGDDHAGRYEGEQIYRSLLDYTRRLFPGVTLQRSLFDQARHMFMPGSIDILHIDGLHTYEAVKHDFTTWFDLVSPQGVILFHDISVLENGFGVHRLWNELKAHFTTLEFHHSHGLGVVFLAPDDPRVSPFVALTREPEAMRAYQSLVADIAGLLPERMLVTTRQANSSVQVQPMAAMDVSHLLEQQQHQIDALLNSTSWRITAPLRTLRSLLGR